ncbi:MAG TPA: hypothetical protein PK794_11405, partial [Armatimonadota bacterium]|nr:hypothetical protein [Armatimonadota bacterium]
MATPIVKTSPITLREAWLPYCIAGVNMLAPTLAARDLLGHAKNAPLIFIMAITFIMLGLPFSIFARQRRYHRILMNLLVLIPLL